MHSQVNELLQICLAKCNILPIIWVAAKYISFSCKNNTLKMSKRRLVLFQGSEKKRLWSLSIHWQGSNLYLLHLQRCSLLAMRQDPICMGGLRTSLAEAVQQFRKH